MRLIPSLHRAGIAKLSRRHAAVTWGLAALTLTTVAFSLAYVQANILDTIQSFLAPSTAPRARGLLRESGPPCTGQGTAFATLPFRQWAPVYRVTTDGVVEEALATLQSLESTPLACTEGNAALVLPAQPKLKELAASLPPWKDSAALSHLSQLQAGSVLLEYLRIYECANVERWYALQSNVELRRQGTLQENHSAGAADSDWQSGDFANETDRERATIEQEMRVARPTLHRVLTVVGGLAKLNGPTVNAACFLRTSLDLRNVLGLLADTAAHLPKAAGRTSLRDLSTAP